MPRRPRPVSRQPPKNSIPAQEKSRQRPLPPKQVAKLKPRVENPSGSSSEEDEDEEDHPEVIGEERDDGSDEEDTAAPRISQWMDDEDLYEHVNDEPVRFSVHRSTYEYLISMQRPIEEGSCSSIHDYSGPDSQHATRPGIGTFWRPIESKAHIR